ncbi:MAG: methionyl-tRNA formyltransferase [Spirochaetes bacterium]|jgi:methionyl-tRNA formyltransferase|nr:methionyl-tRNA formyltransferase [Spirochaetota bacterium]
MNIGFFGTPSVAQNLLLHLCANHNVLFVVTNCDKPAGRNKKICKPPVKLCAESNNLDILQPVNLKDDNLISILQQYNADIFIVFAYGQLIPRSIFDMPRYGTINLHPSKLPMYRGAAPVEWALIDGLDTTAVTIQKITEKLDAGDILAQKEVPITPEMNATDLYDRLIPVGIELIDSVLQDLNNNTSHPVKQDDSLATYCTKISRDTAHIDWNKPAEEIHNQVRAMNPRPGAWTQFRNSELKIWQTRIPEDDDLPSLKPGEIFRLGKRRLLIGCTEMTIEILRLQLIGKKEVDVAAFINGARLELLDSFT